MNPPAEPDDSALARLAKAGSAAAFGTLVHRYHGRVYAFLLTLTRQREDAEDLTQETFLRAWDKFRYFDPERPLVPWLFTLARRQSITAFRRSRPLPEALIAAAESMAPADPEPASRALRLWSLAKSQLTPAAYSALWLHYHEELPVKEMAAILGKREGAVKVMLHRARQDLAASVNGKPPAAIPKCLPEPHHSIP